MLSSAGPEPRSSPADSSGMLSVRDFRPRSLGAVGAYGTNPVDKPSTHRRLSRAMPRSRWALHVHGRLCGLSVPRQHRRLKCSCRLVLGLPARLGGFGLSGSVMNRRIKPSKRAKALAGRESLVPDLYLPDCKLDIEFDSNAEHLTARQATLDATKRMALESDGLKVITVTTSQLASASAMRHVAQEAHARRGTRLRLRCKNFALRQKRLYQLRWSMDDYLDEGWVAAQRSCCRSSALHVEVF